MEARAQHPRRQSRKLNLVVNESSAGGGGSKELNVLSDSKFGLHVLHTHAATWKETNVNCQQFSHETYRFDLGSLRSSAAPSPGVSNSLEGPLQDGSFVRQGGNKGDGAAERAAQSRELDRATA